MRASGLLLVVGIAALGASIGLSRLGAAQSSLLDFCPQTKAGTDCSTAAKMFLEFTKPRDSELINDVNGIVAALANGRYSNDACADSASAIQLIAGAIKDESSRNLVLAVAGTMCVRQHRGGGIKTAPDIISSLVTPVSGSSGGLPPSASSSGSSGLSSSGAGTSSSGSSGSSGLSSSGTSGQSSSGSSGLSSSGAGTSSSGSSGSSGLSSSGTSGQ